MQKLKADLSKPERSGEALKHRVREQIRAFVGVEAAAKLLDPVSPSGDNLLSSIEPILADFLGDRAASELVSRIIDNAVLGI
ncbi:MAG TPA: hypothetical protein VG675_06565 [Bryobacteraceae bacterium]|nr:hypothetical protein [Bryobacteraceae bacterium]